MTWILSNEVADPSVGVGILAGTYYTKASPVLT